MDYYHVWTTCDDTGRSLTCSGQLDIIYVEPIPIGQENVAGSSSLWAGADHCQPIGLGKIGHLPANYGNNSCNMDKQGCAQYAQRYCPQYPTTNMLRSSRGAERQPSFSRRAESIPKTQKQNPKKMTAFYVLVLNCGSAPQNWDLISCSETWTIYFPSDRLQRSATLL